MRIILKILFIINFLILPSKAEIAFIDINHILNASEIGKSLNKQIKNITEENSIKFKDLENELVKKEKSLVSQQNILDKNEFQKKLNSLSIEVKKYRDDKKISQNKVNQIKREQTKKILSLLNPIITNYVQENSISVVIPKKNIIVGKKNLDITDKILKLLNDQVQSINF